MTAIVIASLLGIIPAVIAQKKGKNLLLWWLFGAALFIVALPVALMIKPSPKCPECAEFVRPDAKVCKHCGCRLEHESQDPAENS